MESKNKLVLDIMSNLAKLKVNLDPDGSLTLEEYDIQYGDVEEIQYLMYTFAKGLKIVE